MVAKEDIAIGDPVTADSVESSSSRTGGRGEHPHPGCLHADRPARPDGRRGRTAGKPGSRGLEHWRATSIIQLRPGEKAIAFQVDRVTGLDFLIQAGDSIDIVLAEQLQVLQPTADTANLPRNQQRFEVVTGIENAKTVKTILQNKRVLYVSATRVRPATTGTASASPAAGQQAAAAAIENVIIIFAGTDQDAEVIKFAQNDLGEIGALTAVLRSHEDNDTERTTGITLDRLVEEYGIPLPGIITDLGRNQEPIAWTVPRDPRRDQGPHRRRHPGDARSPHEAAQLRGGDRRRRRCRLGRRGDPDSHGFASGRRGHGYQHARHGWDRCG